MHKGMDLSTLQSRASSAYIPPHRTQLHPRLYSIPTPKPSSSLSQHSRDKWLIIAAFVLTVPFLFYLFSLAQGLHRSSKFTNPNPGPILFGLVLHASPSACRIRVFHSLNDAPIPFIASNFNSNSLKLRPGLPDDPGAAGPSILGLIEFAQRRVPRSTWSSTKVQLELEGLGAELTEAALESCRRVLRSSGFLFRDEWARVMKGVF
ncbi:putative apyrase 6 [Vitis vinifera]|uniref:Putative apyrase 6 n=1 Tax=Vitis vinifera TaxID=29760 RepID=A0A438FLY8_VITVI|nr:putative apyrase 6 [Vitis vinifera]